MVSQNKSILSSLFIIGVLFFVFGFISWINAILIPYFELICSLTTAQAMLVTFAFYISYFIMAFPASIILKKTGFKNGIFAGLLIMSLGSLLFIPAAATRTYPIFLIGLFVLATGLTILQTASNPYVTILGPIESAARRISIMGICNKVAGALAPLILVKAVTKSPDEIDHLKQYLPTVSLEEQATILNELSSRLIVPYVVISIILIALGCMIRYSSLPEIESSDTVDNARTRNSIFDYPYALLGAVTIFFAVSVEVLVVDSIIGYGQSAGFSFRDAKYLATYTLLLMIVSYGFATVLIPKYLSQQKALLVTSMAGLILSAAVLLTDKSNSVWCLCLLGLFNALLWPTIWPLAIDGLGKFTKQVSALMVMGIIGGALTPLLYGYLADRYDPQSAYWILIPCYFFIIFFAYRGHKIGRSRIG